MSTALVSDLRVDGDRMVARLHELGAVGGLPGGGCARLALTDDDKAGRDLVRAVDARPRPRRHDRRGGQRGRRARRARRPGAGHDRLPHRHRAHRRPVRRQPRGAGRAGGGGDAGRCRGHHAPPARRGLLHRRGGRALPSRHAGQPGLRRWHDGRGGARRRGDRRRPPRRRAGPHRLPRRRAVPGRPALRLRRAAHRAGAGPRGRRHHHRCRHRCAGHLLAGGRRSPAGRAMPAPRPWRCDAIPGWWPPRS